jgi:hypothetical protein
MVHHAGAAVGRNIVTGDVAGGDIHRQQEQRPAIVAAPRAVGLLPRHQVR